MRHLRTEKRRRWHIDYLLCPSAPGRIGGIAEIAQLWWAESADRLECTWARTVLGYPAASVPVPRFGSSDCQCPAHLIAWARPEELDALSERLLGDRPGGKLSLAAEGITR
jgi:Uri superfamily endonuclease